jgi:hypothetical protein
MAIVWQYCSPIAIRLNLARFFAHLDLVLNGLTLR